jgi:hypothetical protein
MAEDKPFDVETVRLMNLHYKMVTGVWISIISTPYHHAPLSEQRRYWPDFLYIYKCMVEQQ